MSLYTYRAKNIHAETKNSKDKPIMIDKEHNTTKRPYLIPLIIIVLFAAALCYSLTHGNPSPDSGDFEAAAEAEASSSSGNKGGNYVRISDRRQRRNRA